MEIKYALPKQIELAERLKALSVEQWGVRGAVNLLGRHPALREAQQKLSRFARVDSPILIMGESGVGKELFARSLYLFSHRKGKPFLTVNSAQYQDENLLVSELFGHKKGSFTGAVSDRRGIFEEADGGIVFLDEVGELPLKAQAMLLRALGEGEIMRLGECHHRKVDVRVVAATNQDLKQMVAQGRFRQDLYYRLCYLRLVLPPVRERGNDWKLIAEDWLAQLNHKHSTSKQLSAASVAVLGGYHWPGNVREIRGIIEIGFCLSGSLLIEPEHFQNELESATGVAALGASVSAEPANSYRQMALGDQDFWEVVRQPFLDRELNRAQVQAIIKQGLEESEGSYKRLLDIFQVPQDDYLKFMDFLRHHRLKPRKAHSVA